MKATFEDKQLMKDSLQSICETVYKFGELLIDKERVSIHDCPMTTFRRASEIAIEAIELSASHLDEKQKQKLRDETIDKYTKIDYNGQDE